MNLDFSQCKTKEDVEKIFKKHKKEFEVLEELEEVLNNAG
ncbi:hypothetical protein LCGC14_1118860 [marine sediment metagenome]|uniref:Uncharacterized protein n=1 Tax=marine sediment metagenome TaxID=412755 RepID=A0A0F9PMS4_9ZZZZ